MKTPKSFNVPLRIALRYLFAGRGVSGRISLLSVGGIAVGTAALIVILSVYNGFEGYIRLNQDRTAPDYVVRPAQGKTFVPSDGLLDAVRALDGVLTADPVLREKVYAGGVSAGAGRAAKGTAGAGRAAGTPVAYALAEAVGVDGSAGPALSSVLAARIGRGSVTLYYPDMAANFSPSNPAVKSLVLAKPTVYRADAPEVYLPASDLRTLLGLPEGAFSSIELRTVGIFDPYRGTAADDAGAARALTDDAATLAAGAARTLAVVADDAGALSALLGPDFVILDREAQNPALYRMMRFEKLVIALILFFVVVIVAFTLAAGLRMLRIEKRGDMQTLGALGLSSSAQGRVFFLEGVLLTLLGLTAGLALGLLITALQAQTGLIKMPGLMGQPYPVDLRLADVLLTAAGVFLIGLLGTLFSRRSSC